MIEWSVCNFLDPIHLRVGNVSILLYFICFYFPSSLYLNLCLAFALLFLDVPEKPLVYDHWARYCTGCWLFFPLLFLHEIVIVWNGNTSLWERAGARASAFLSRAGHSSLSHKASFPMACTSRHTYLSFLPAQWASFKKRNEKYSEHFLTRNWNYMLTSHKVGWEPGILTPWTSTLTTRVSSWR